MNKHRYVRAQGKSQLRQLREPQIALPQRIERQQHAGRIRATPAQAPAGGNMFNHLDIGAQGDAAVSLQRPGSKHRQILLRTDVGQAGTTRDATVLAHRQPDLIAAIDQLEQRLKIVIAICSPSGDV